MAIKRKYSLEELQEIAGAMQSMGIVQKHTPSSLTLDGNQLHGPLQSGTNYGPFSDPGIRPEMFSTLVRPMTMASLLSPEKSEYANELLEIATGVTAEGGTNATGWCGDPPEPGLMKVCRQSYIFGQHFTKTGLNAIPEIGKLRNRADVPRQILNAGPTANPYIPDILYYMDDTRSQLRYELWRLGVGVERSWERVAITGSTALASTATQWGWIQEFNGLEQLIKTGHTDAETGTSCPSLDSEVVNWGGNDVGATVNGRTISAVLVDMLFAAMSKADQMGMGGTNFAFIMRHEMFRMIADEIACNFATYRCTNTAQQVDSLRITEERLRMYNNRFLWLDGIAVPVYFSDGITQAGFGNSTYQGDLFFVPLSWAGTRLLRFEYFPMDNPYAKEFAGFQGLEPTTINNGLYAIASRDNGFCKEYLLAMQGRLILEAPWLAGRVDNVRFTYRADTRAPYYGESFYVDGGETYRS